MREMSRELYIATRKRASHLVRVKNLGENVGEIDPRSETMGKNFQRKEM